MGDNNEERNQLPDISSSSEDENHGGNSPSPKKRAKMLESSSDEDDNQGFANQEEQQEASDNNKVRMLVRTREIPLLATPRSTFHQTPSRKLLRFFIVASVIYGSRKKF